MRVAQPIVLNEETRRKLEQQSRGRSTQARVVLRSRIVLLAAEGLQNKQIAAALNVAPRMAALWRVRFIERGIEGLLRDAPRPGRAPSISRTSLIEKTTRSTPVTATQWSTRAMAREDGHLQGLGVAHLARQRPEAASRGKLQGQQRSELRG
jgi:transposase